MRTLKYIWLLPLTLTGYLLGLTCGKLPDKFNIIESTKGFAWLLYKLGFEAICLGYVIIHYNRFGDINYIDFIHEITHLRQQEKWGVFFILAYIFAGFIAVSQGKDFYWDNYFEVEAGRGVE